MKHIEQGELKKRENISHTCLTGNVFKSIGSRASSFCASLIYKNQTKYNVYKKLIHDQFVKYLQSIGPKK